MASSLSFLSGPPQAPDTARTASSAQTARSSAAASTCSETSSQPAKKKERRNIVSLEQIKDRETHTSSRRQAVRIAVQEIENIDPAEVQDTPEQKAEKHKFRLEAYSRMLRRGRQASTRRDEKKLRKHLNDPTASERMPMGQLSSKVYEEIATQRSFDRYNRQVFQKEKATSRLMESLKATLASKLKPRDYAKPQQGRDEEDPNYLTTKRDKIGNKPPVLGPAFCATAPHSGANSEGNEKLYNYDGFWRNGRPHGKGKYLYGDGKTYTGDWHGGHATGVGEAQYSSGHVYEGDWKDGKFHGKGYMTYKSGIVYEGKYRDGKRHGYGELRYPSGYVYKGEFKFDEPYGFGEATSEATGISFNGMWQNGTIYGPGTLVLSPNDVIARDWRRMGGWTFQEIIEYVRDERMQAKEDKESLEEEIHGIATQMILRDYILDVKREIKREKRAELDERKAEQKRVRERQKEKRKQAQLAMMRGLTAGSDG